MGSRGYNAGGLAYMRRVRCPKCGRSFPVGHERYKNGPHECSNTTACRDRQAKQKEARRG